MLKIVQNNPYRFLGVCSNAPTAERLANSRKLNAFLKVNKEVSFPLDLTNLMPSFVRTTDGMNAANNSINLPKDQLKYALFWFINSSAIDKMALEYLQNGNTSKSSELFGKKETFSSLIIKVFSLLLVETMERQYNVSRRLSMMMIIAPILLKQFVVRHSIFQKKIWLNSLLMRCLKRLKSVN